MLDTLVFPQLKTEALGVGLAEVARRHADEFILMVWDGAGGHRAKRLPVPANRRLALLPPWSPPLNPAEHAWDEVRETYCANRWFATLDQLDSQLVTALAALQADTPPIASLTGFDWITCVPINAH